MYNLYDILVISGSVIGLFMSLSIATSPFFRSNANMYLSVSVLLLTIILFTGWLNTYTGIIGLVRAIMWELLVPITLLYYFLIRINHRIINNSKFKFLYIPFFVFLIFDIWVEFDFSLDLFQVTDYMDLNTVQLVFDVESWLALLLCYGSMIYACILIRKSKTEKSIRQWLLRLNYMLLVIISLWFCQELGKIFFESTYDDQIIWVCISMLFFFVLYVGIFKLQIAVEHAEIHKIRLMQKQNAVKENDCSEDFADITKIEKSDFYNQLSSLLENDEMYKNPLLSRHDLAVEMGVSEGYLSKRVNQEFGKSVIHLINDYRISEAKRLLCDSEFKKYSIEAISLEAGFKSKSVFYSAFKSATNMSPGVFRKHHFES